MHCRRILYQLSYQGSPRGSYPSRFPWASIYLCVHVFLSFFSSSNPSYFFPYVPSLIFTNGPWCELVHLFNGFTFPLKSPKLDCSFLRGFLSSSVDKESACNAGDPGSIPGLGRSLGEGIDYPLQYSWASLVAQLVKNLPAVQQTWVQSLGWEDPLEKGKATTPIFWPGEFHGLCSPWSHKESDTTERLSFLFFHFHGEQIWVAWSSTMKFWVIPCHVVILCSRCVLTFIYF